MPKLNRKKRVALAVLICHVIHSESLKRKKSKRKKRQKSLRKPSVMPILRELEECDTSDFKYSLRMSEANFQELLVAVTPLIKRRNTPMRMAITPERRLAATLRYLATGQCVETLQFSTAISPQSLAKIIPETCAAIVKVLRNKYLACPLNETEWRAVAKDFEEYWNFPNCGGAIGGKHIQIHPPPNSGSFYLNYREFFSIILMAVVNANHEFIMAEVGKNGSLSDSEVLKTALFHQRLTQKKLKLPTTDETKDRMNFVFIADNSFDLHENILKPFPEKVLTQERKIYNYRLSRAGRVVENTFGILASRFQIVKNKIYLSPEKAELVVMACCVLHNFLRRKNSAAYIPVNVFDHENVPSGTVIPGDWRNDTTGLIGLQTGFERNSSCGAESNREQYLRYFNNQGVVPWQNEMVQKF